MRSTILSGVRSAILLMCAATIWPDASIMIGAASQSNQPAELAGAWVLNKDLSDDPEKAMQRAQEERQRSGGGRMPGGTGGFGGIGGRGRRGGSGGGSGGMDHERMQEMRAQMMRALQAPERLTIAQGDGTITFTGPDGVAQVYKTDNKKEKHEFDGRRVDVKVKRNDKELVKETSLGDRMKLIETYSRLTEKPQLLVQVKLQGRREITLRRVYDDTAR